LIGERIRLGVAMHLITTSSALPFFAATAATGSDEAATGTAMGAEEADPT